MVRALDWASLKSYHTLMTTRRSRRWRKMNPPNTRYNWQKYSFYPYQSPFCQLLSQIAIFYHQFDVLQVFVDGQYEIIEANMIDKHPEKHGFNLVVYKGHAVTIHDNFIIPLIQSGKGPAEPKFPSHYKVMITPEGRLTFSCWCVSFNFWNL